jgi:hypothetical protein
VRLIDFAPFDIESTSGMEKGLAFRAQRSRLCGGREERQWPGRFEGEQTSVAVRTSVGMESNGEELLMKIRKLEMGQEQLEQEMSKFIPNGAERRHSQSVSVEAWHAAAVAACQGEAAG